MDQEREKVILRQAVRDRGTDRHDISVDRENDTRQGKRERLIWPDCLIWGIKKRLV